ncbi:hypothetical protein [Bryobacter aggregatus]|uniref:hypothetical protein n=1 Tax=Bryobacter aggregatus TaxID=360054 RepID=UPI0004E1FE27|nr:hypothetical protein [Bryobacter aggregatus]
MTPTPLPFSIRSLATTGNTRGDLRRAIRSAPPEANLVLLTGTPRFLPICPNCEARATHTLHVERPFLFHIPADDETPSSSESTIDAFEIPFCDRCLQQQRSSIVAQSPWLPLRRIFSESHGPAGVVVMAISLLFFIQTLKHFSLVPLLLGCIPLAIGLSLLIPVWRKSAYMAVPAPTEVDQAVDFTPILSLEFEPAWRAYLFRSSNYASQFRAANESQVWDLKSKAAAAAAAARRKKTNRTNWIIGTILGVFCLWMLWDEVISPWLR